MKIVCFDRGGIPAWGIRHGDRIAVHDRARSALDLLDASTPGEPSG